ncbi:hypothetical protein Aasi_1218 [Candidatus Amoebophilus asiaticus 5a2]|uniref:U-box domain-containing protein n=1 Tax=Amoebophilus asiaticus (strain 5a2) TaxID=452471 RepID=B3ETJ3_AMOA5|nr:U-box domain-containing protein [Candidatus Amoebophilus asiaticus]ACE06545.1 hypothetical protein Aasi_1218 [Candidatus Amoebophilus asiaticus 5a2]
MEEGEEEAAEDKLSDENIPDECFCPITQEIMEDPVIAQDSHSYERSAIQRWFDVGKRVSPMTGKRLLSTELIANYTMRSLIQDIKAQVPVLTRHKLDIRNIEAAIKLREEEIEEKLIQKGHLVEKESQERLSLEEKLQQKEIELQQHKRKLEEKTAQLHIMEKRIGLLKEQVNSFIERDKQMRTTMQECILQMQQYMVQPGPPVSSSSSSVSAFQQKVKEGVLEGNHNNKAEQDYPAVSEQKLRYFLDSKRLKGKVLDEQEAIKHCKEGATIGHMYAQYVLGNKYRSGRQGLKRNYAKAKRWYEKAAEQGYAEAQYKLGAMYDNGEGVTIDFIEAKKCYEKAACQGVAVAQARLASLYYYGRGVQLNRAEAERLCLQIREKIAIDAQKGDADCQLSLGWMYYHGCGIRRNYSRAMAWYLKSANQGCAAAQNNLGVMYAYDWFGAIKKDYTKAREWYQKAAEQGYAHAQSNLGGLYYSGQGVEKDDRKACEWYQKAAEQGYAHAQYSLGIMYRNGFGVGKDNIKAIEWFRKAAEKGYEDAQIILNSVVIHFSS